MPTNKQQHMQRHKPPPLDQTQSDQMLSGQTQSEQAQPEQTLTVVSSAEQAPTVQSDATLPKPPSPGVFDWEDWLFFMEEFECTEAQKKELIEIYWQIILAFADIQWQMGSSDTAREVDNSDKNIDLSAVMQAFVLQSEDTNQTINKSEKESVKLKQKNKEPV